MDNRRLVSPGHLVGAIANCKMRIVPTGANEVGISSIRNFQLAIFNLQSGWILMPARVILTAYAQRLHDVGARHHNTISHPLRYSLLTNLFASGLLVNVRFGPSHSSLVPAKRIPMLPKRTVSVSIPA